MAEVSGVIQGNLMIDKDAGDERLFWAIRDNRQSNLYAPEQGLFVGMHVVDPVDTLRAGRVAEATDVKGKPYTRGYRGGISYNVVDWADGQREHLLSSQLLVRHWPVSACVRLETADYLTVFDVVQPETVVWEGFVRFIKQTQHRDLPSVRERPGVQADVERDIWAYWFDEQFPARLEQPKNR